MILTGVHDITSDIVSIYFALKKVAILMFHMRRLYELTIH